MMSKAVTQSTGGYEKKDKNGNPTGKYTNAQDNYTCSTYSKSKEQSELELSVDALENEI